MMHDGSVIVEGGSEEMRANAGFVHDLYLGAIMVPISPYVPTRRCSQSTVSTRSTQRRMSSTTSRSNGIHIDHHHRSASDGMGETTLCAAIMGLSPPRQRWVASSTAAAALVDRRTGWPVQGFATLPEERPLPVIDRRASPDLHRSSSNRAESTATASTTSLPGSPSEGRDGGARLSGGGRCASPSGALSSETPKLLIMDEPSRGPCSHGGRGSHQNLEARPRRSGDSP